MSNIIDKIQLSGVTYDIGGSGSVSTAITSGDTNAVAGGAVYDKFDEVEQVTAAALNELNDKVNPTVELTQAQYDALVTAGTVQQDTYYIITDATAVDMANYYTTAQTNSLLSRKQNTLVSGTNIKTINNESILGSGNISVEGKGVVGSTNISVSTGTTDYTINFTPSIWAGTDTNAIKENNSSNTASGSYSHAEGNTTKASGNVSHAEGYKTKATGNVSHAEGYNTTASTNYAHAEGEYTLASGEASHAEGYNTTASTKYAHAEGRFTTAQNEAEHASGRYNVSSKANTTFGDSGNTLFSVGNGSDSEYRHNVLDIRQNGDIYIVDTSASGDYDAKPMIKLQESLGGTASTAITSGDTNAVAGGAVYDKFDEVEQVTAQALNVLNDRLDEDEEVTAAALNTLNESLSGKQDTLIAGTNITIVDNVISAEGGGSTYTAGDGINITNDVISVTGKTNQSDFTAHTASTVHMTTTEKTNLDSLATNIAAISGITSTKVGNWNTASTNSHTHSNKTVLDGINSTKVSNWDGAATNASNAITALGGLKLVKLTQAQYDALATKDNSTLYVIVG
jgi:hypothetical protein